MPKLVKPQKTAPQPTTVTELAKAANQSRAAATPSLQEGTSPVFDVYKCLTRVRIASEQIDRVGIYKNQEMAKKHQQISEALHSLMEDYDKFWIEQTAKGGK